MMKSDAPLDYAVFQLSPKRSRCELFVSSDGSMEKLASGLLKPFVSHLKIAEEHVTSSSQTVKLEVGRRKNAEAWFTKGTIERFVRFVSTPEVLELVNTYDAEMSQLEAARRIYSQGGEQIPGGGASSTSDDATKKELLRAIDVRLVAVQQDLSAAYSRSAAAGFNIDTVSELQMFADTFGAHRLKEACSKFITLSESRPNLVGPRKSLADDRALRSSCGSDMSIDRDDEPPTPPLSQDDVPEPEPSRSSQSARRLSVQDRINMFENKQKENSGGKSSVVKSVELRRMSSDVSSAAGADKAAVLRRWSGESDMSVDLGSDKKDNESNLSTPSSSVISRENKVLCSNDCDDVAKISCSNAKQEIIQPVSVSEGGIKFKDGSFNTSESSKSKLDLVSGESDGSKYQMRGERLENFEDKLNSMISGGGNREGNAVKFGDKGKSKIPVGVGERNEPRSQIDERRDKSKESGNVETLTRRENYPQESTTQTRLKPSTAAGDSSVSENVSGSRIREAFAAHCKDFGGDLSSNKKDTRPVQESEEVVKQSEIRAPEKESNFEGSSKKKYFRAQGFDSFSTPPPEQSQRGRKPKGNQDLHDELKMKANELEKLFAEHKLRAAEIQVSSDVSNKTKLDNDEPLHQNFAELSVSEGSRGKLYDRYMQKRDAKLREDWGSKRAEKEARLKFMHDNLERSRSEMKEKFSRSLDARDSVSSARRRAERLRSYNSRSIMKKEQQSLDFGDSEDDEEASNLLEKNIITQEDKSLDEDSSVMDSVSRGVRGKRLTSNSKNTLSSSTPRALLAPASKSAVRNPPANSSKRRTLQPENPLAQSVPNFSDLRKENTKPLGGTKTTRSQPRYYSRNKSTGEESSLSKEEINNRSRRSQATRHAYANTSESREIFASDGGFGDDIPENTSSKPFLKKGSRARYVSQANIAKQKISLEPEPVEDVKENDEFFTSAADEITSAAKYDEEEGEEFGTSNAEGHEALDPSETDKFVNSESENGDGASSTAFSQVDRGLGTSQFPNSVQDWPFSYTHETSDVDAYAESPISSVASWNSRSMNHEIENDAAARMRRKWGTAQKPLVMTQNSSSHSRKDVTRGFKRLLKFGRKNRGSEGFVDWVSATTSEGDDDAEDVREVIANRSSEDLRKSRMGQQFSEENFNESEFDNESVQSSHPAISSTFKLREDHISGGSSVKAPRSFFSFMSKGSESKAR